ncbi:MAG: hypothetical protein ACOX6E_07840, partial [Syntrophomonadaceae bacterium]
GLWLSTVMTPLVWGQNQDNNSKKVIILISDYINTSDLINAHTPNIDTLISQSGSGLMNIRAKNNYPSSSYMTLATGFRVGTINNAGLCFNSDEEVHYLPNLIDNIKSSSLNAGYLYSLFTANNAPKDGVVNLFIEPVKKSALSYNPPYEVGSLGKEARDMGYRIAILGNSDTYYTPNRNAAILAMDEKGIIPLGNVSKNLLETNPNSPGGLQSNHDLIIDNMNNLLKFAEIIIIDMGDTSRVEMVRNNMADCIVADQRNKAVERNDQLLGRIINSINMEKTMLVVLSPNPNKDMIKEGNFGLTPVIIYTPGSDPGLLISNTTRRPGLISNTDLKPTVLSYLHGTSNISGLSIIKSNNSMSEIDRQLNIFKKIRLSRNPLHYAFMLLSLLGAIIGALTFVFNRQQYHKYLNYTVYCTLSMPIVFLFIGFSQYFSLAGVILLSVGLAMLIAAVIYLVFREPLNALLFLTLTTAILLVYDTFTNSQLMLLSPLGSDAIAGGRFYGIGNDYMGVLLASTVISVFLLFDKFKHLPLKSVHKAILGLVPLAVVSIAIGHPQFGANMGGFITAIVTTGFFLLLVKRCKISLSKIILILVLAILAVFSVAQMDALFNPTPSHAGKAISNMTSASGLANILAMIKTKLGILGNTIYNSGWSLILLLFTAILALLKFKTPHLLFRLAVENPLISQAAKLLLVTSITVFIVNDTGVIAAALVLLYLTNSLWLALSRGNHQGW